MTRGEGRGPLPRRGAPERPLAVRVYAWLLARMLDLGERSEEAAAVFGELYADARGRGRAQAALVWTRSVAKLVLAAFEEWREGERLVNRGNRMSGVVLDLRYSLRALARRPGFALPVVLILAVGIGATTTIFSAVDTVVLRDLPYPQAGRLVFFDDGDHSYPSYRAWRELPAFEAVAALSGGQVDLVGEGSPQRLRAGYVSPEFFPMLGAAPELGRFFAPGEYREESEVVVLSDAFWRRVWGADPGIVGRAVRVDGRLRTVVGIVAREFRLPSAVTPTPMDVWMPLGDGGVRRDNHGYHVLSVAARLTPGVSLEAAQAQLDEQRAAFAESLPDRYLRSDGSLATVPLLPLKEASVRRIRPILLMSLGAVGLLLLIACANVANLFLARGTARIRETVLRQALGAGRARVVRQVLSEGALLALVGGALGVGLAYAGVAAFQRFAPAGIPGMDRVAVDTRILAITLLLSVGTALLFGLLPAVQAARSSVGDALREGMAAVTGSRAARRARSGLVALQIALALVLTTSAGLLFRSFVGILQVEPGFQVEGLTVLSLELNDQYGPEQRVAFTEQLLERVRRIPGVLDASGGVTLPFTRTGGSRCCWSTRVQGATPIDEENAPRFFIQPVADGYFAALGAPILAGRDFEVQDGAGGPPVAIVNASAARELFGAEDVVGRTISFDDRALTVIGVEDDLHHWGLSQPAENNVYVPYHHLGGQFAMLNVAVRSEVPLETLAPALRESVWALEPNLPISGVQSMEQQVSGSLAAPRFLAFLFGVFASVSLLLACFGIYSSMLYAVGQRTREMGIRYAVGASAREIVTMVLRSGLGVALLGTLGGLAASAAVSRVIGSLLWNVAPRDPLTYVLSAALLAGTALIACLVPALKAARADPLSALRSE